MYAVTMANIEEGELFLMTRWINIWYKYKIINLSYTHIIIVTFDSSALTNVSGLEELIKLFTIWNLEYSDYEVSLC